MQEYTKKNLKKKNILKEWHNINKRRNQLKNKENYKSQNQTLKIIKFDKLLTELKQEK